MVTALPFDKLNSKDPKEKYGFAKELLRLGAEQPEALYPYYQQWTKMIDGDNKILKWTAVDILGYLSAVDSENKTEGVIGDLFELLHSGDLIVCNHAVFALGKIAEFQPEKRSLILHELSKITNDSFKSATCRAIAYGKVLEVFKSFISEVAQLPAVAAFIDEALHSELKSTVKKANWLFNKVRQYES